jgi:hypothetical protein
MSALQAVENYLAELNYLTTAQNENAYVNPTAIVQDLQQAVIGEVNEEQLGIIFRSAQTHHANCSLVFLNRPCVLPHFHWRELHPPISREIGWVSGSLTMFFYIHLIYCAYLLLLFKINRTKSL